MSKRWIVSPLSPEVPSVVDRWRLPAVVAQLLINRGMATDDSGQSFLTPQLKDLPAPSLLHDAAKAARLIVESIRSQHKIVLYGDYDVDGTTGVAILWHTLTLAGADVSFYVPHRVDEGYGLNLDAVRKIVEGGAKLIVSVDCGVTAVDIAETTRKLGCRLIITDHHTVGPVLPEADAIVHPGLDEAYPNPHLCGAGVAFKLAWAIGQELSGDERVDGDFRKLLVEMLPLAALGTIADVVPLVGENRIIAKCGLSHLSETSIPGLRALMESAGLLGGKIDDYDVGFKLGPRINAAGRMGHARLAVELFTRATADRAREIALYLEEHNRSRKSTERKIVRRVNELIERDGLASDARRAIVVAGDGWHPGVIGIVAARLVDKYQRPAVVIALADGEGQGSGRSIRHFDLAQALADCSEHLITQGGHKMAAGLRIAEENVAPFTEAFVSLANNRLTGDDLVEKLRLDGEVKLKEMTLPTAEAIGGLGPFGMGNPKPKFATDWLDLAAEPRGVGSNGEHLQAQFHQNGVRLKAIGFGMTSHLDDLKRHRRCQVAFEPLINEFNGRRTVEMRIIDLKFPEGS